MLELIGVKKTFNPGTVNAKTALAGIDLHLKEGDFVTVIGGNGAGKSTTMNAIAGSWPIDEGKIIIDVSDQRVFVYQWNGSNYDNLVGEMICSTGLRATPTPLGTYQAAGPTGTGEWYYFKEYNCYAKWATRIIGGILFHSVTYSRGKVPSQSARQNLGRRASHGCVRLKVEDALWTYEHCYPGTTVVVQE